MHKHENAMRGMRGMRGVRGVRGVRGIHVSFPFHFVVATPRHPFVPLRA
jgi:hypothetical protein